MVNGLHGEYETWLVDDMENVKENVMVIFMVN